MSLGNPQSFNRNSYVENEPTNFVDPSGLLMILVRCEIIGEGRDGRPVYGNCTFQFINIGNDPFINVGGGHGEGGGGGDEDPCDVKWVLFPNGMREYLGLQRKSGTSRKHQFGTLKTVESIREIGEAWQGVSDTKIRAGDISLFNGVNTPDHSEHERGRQFDIGLFRKDGQNSGVTYKDSNYDRETTQKLVDLLEKNEKVTKIIFNDPQIKGKKISRDSTGVHDNHLHVEFNDGC